MNVIDSLLMKIGLVRSSVAESRVEDAKRRAIVSSVYAVPQGTGIYQEKSYYELVNAYKSWVYTCIDKIAKSIAMVPIRLYVYRDLSKGEVLKEVPWKNFYKSLDKGERQRFLKELRVEREEIFDHPFFRLIRRPNAFMTRFILWYETMIRLELGGMCAWLIYKNGLGIPSEIWPLPLTKTARLAPKVTKDLKLEYWIYEDGDIRQKFRPDELFVMKYPHPSSPFQGMSPLMAQSYPYDIDLFLMQQQKSLFERGAVPGLFLTTDQRLTSDVVKEIKDQIDEQYAGALRSGGTLVTHSGLKPERLGLSGREVMIREVERFARDKLITAFDLSPGKVGLVEDVNRANMEALNETFIQECLRPKCMLIEEEIESFLLPLYDSALTCDFDFPDYSDKEFRLRERESNLKNYLTTINEERSKMGLRPVPWGDVPLASFGVGPLTVAGSSIEESKAPEFEDKAFDGRLEEWKIFVRRSEKFEQRLTEVLRNYFAAVRSEVLDRLNRYGKRYLGQYAGWSRQKILDHLKIRPPTDVNIDVEQEERRLTEIVAPVVRSIMKESGNVRIRALEKLKIKGTKTRIEFDDDDPRVVRWLGSRMRKFSREVAGTTFDAIESVLREGFSEGRPIPVIAETLMEKFESWDKYRAPLIARTETISAMNRADIESVYQMKLEKKLLKHWLTAGDEAVRETHARAGEDYGEGNGIPIDEEFRVGRDRMMVPGDGRYPEENIQCRCTVYYSEIEEKQESFSTENSILEKAIGIVEKNSEAIDSMVSELNVLKNRVEDLDRIPIDSLIDLLKTKMSERSDPTPIEVSMNPIPVNVDLNLCLEEVRREPPQKRRRMIVERDGSGRITSAKIVEEDDDE